MAKIGVGIIGANAERGWAIGAHIPALAASPDFELVAVSTSNDESARRAGEKFGVQAYGNANDLIADSNVELVVICVRIPLHRPLVESAIAAGKPILCEWSLGAGLEESIALADKAETAGVRGWVGLQARSAPAYRHVKKLVDEGYVGDILSSTIIASGANWGPVIQPENAYILDANSHAGMLVIPFGHTMEGVCSCLGEPRRVSAMLATRRASATNTETGCSVPMTVPDQVAATMELESGAILSTHFRGGMSAGINFHWEINGTLGDIVVIGPSGLTEMCELTVSGAKSGETLAVLPTPAECLWGDTGLAEPAAPSYNLALAYAALAKDWADKGSRVPTFRDAVRRSRLIAAIETSAASGQVVDC